MVKNKIGSYLKLTLLLCGALFVTFALLENSFENTLNAVQNKTIGNRILLMRKMAQNTAEGNLREMFGQLAKTAGVDFAVINPEGRIVFSTPGFVGRNCENPLEFREVRIVNGFVGTIPDKFVLRQDGRGIFAATRMRMADGGEYLLWVFEPRESMGKFNFMLLFGVCFILVVFLIALGFLVMRPLGIIVEIVQDVSRGDDRGGTKGFRDFIRLDFPDLTVSIRKMHRRLKNKIRDVHAVNSTLEAVLMSMTEGVLVVDNRQMVLLVNHALKEFFTVRGDPSGVPLVEVVRNYHVIEAVKATLKLDQNQGVFSKEINIRYPVERTLLVHGTRLGDKNDVQQGAVLIFHDITSLRQLETTRKDFVANVSHELRTPLQSIGGYAETLIDGALEDKETAVDFVRIIHDSAKRLTALVSDLLELSRLEKSEANQDFLNAQPMIVVNRAVPLLKHKAAEKSIDMEVVEPDEELPEIYCNSDQLVQALSNLVDNAIKYTPDRGRVRVWVSVVEDGVSFNVKDSGMGIAEHAIGRIFERFYRVDKSRTNVEGTGLGLAIVKHIVQRHKGRIDVDSMPEKGSLFSFVIPCAPKHR